MSISFNQIQANLRVPLFYAEFDNSRASTGGATQEYNTLLIGPRLSTGTVAAGTLQRITSADQAAQYFGVNSVLANMAAAHLAINTAHPLFCVGLADAGGGVAATGTVTFTASTPAAGIINFLIGGRSISVTAATTDTATTLAASLVAAVNADSYCLVTAANTAGVVTLTADNKGTQGNEIDIRYSHFDGQSVPSGITVAVVAMASGAGNPDITTVWPLLGDDQYILISTPWTDAVTMGALNTQLVSRFGPNGLDDGYAIMGKRATFSGLTTLGALYNSQFLTVMTAVGPSNPWEQAAAACALIALSASNDPAMPFQTLVLSGIITPNKTERFVKSDRNQLLYAGIATTMVDSGGNVMLEGMITTFKQNSFGSPDVSYLYLNTLLTLSYLRFDWAALITSRYARVKLADDGTTFGPGQAIVTPSVIKAEAINKYKQWELEGLVEDYDTFAANLIVERNANNKNRLDVLMPPNLVNQFVVMANKIQFIL